MNRILVIALLVVSVIVLVRTIMNTPMIRGAVESFQNSGSASSMLNTSTECPANTQMYMYDGVAYCCGGGKLNRDADDVMKTCRPIPTKPAPTFCTLGPTKGEVKNCLELRAGILEALGEKVCPLSKPNFAMTTSGQGRCCAGAITSDGTDCADSNPSWQCNVGTDPNELKDDTDCRFLKEREGDSKCPDKYVPFTAPGQGDLAGLYLYGCSDMNQNCYSKALIARLKELKFSTDNLTPCVQ